MTFPLSDPSSYFMFEREKIIVQHDHASSLTERFWRELGVCHQSLERRDARSWNVCACSYDNRSKKLLAIPPLSNDGRMGFGLAATEDDRIVCVGGHNFNYETLSSVTILDTKAEKYEWKTQPDMPSE